ncbi:hypothetical protein O7598_10300 [Micromonospora sp. WMMC241]|uniref:hypothetical protein n=1 Tax=Micromonospora sp. WMMC241 TaxID=3015159 RepID=UPI0022B65215|nr:hypothetical protein [Micromonospora sp. WMMC241]MCZ7436782.1 hypothetical protein [Micromonospora sp. WMMC241]
MGRPVASGAGHRAGGAPVEDVDDARELVEQRMRAAGMEESIFDRIIDLLERFDTDREKLFEEMLDKLEASGYDGLRDRWSTNCEQAEALLERLEENMVDILEDSQADARSATERMAAVGPVDFLAGERRIWAQVAKGDVPDAATLMAKVLEADLAVIKKCEEDLKKVRDDDKVVEALIVKNFGSISATAIGATFRRCRSTRRSPSRPSIAWPCCRLPCRPISCAPPRPASASRTGPVRTRRPSRPRRRPRPPGSPRSRTCSPG